MKLTGNTRHRVSLFGKLIIQVEHKDAAGKTHWRDAGLMIYMLFYQLVG